MARVHLMELEDQAWFPRVLRDAGTGFLNTSHRVTGLDELFIPKIVEVLKKSKSDRLVDLGSGAGGPTPEIVKKVRQVDGCAEVNVTLTDYYPHQGAIAAYRNSPSTPFIKYHPESVDAARVPDSLRGVRTMFLSYHHMRPDTAQMILADAQRTNQPIAIFEAFGRNLPSFIGMLPSVFAPFFIMPLVRPFKWTNLFFTYLVPLVPLLVLFDGWVSYLRTYSPAELRAMIAKLPPSEGYRWEVGELGKQKAPYVIGYPA